MKKHEELYIKIRKLLIQNFQDEISEIEEENHLSIGDTGIWIMSDDREFTIGYGLTHRHYDPEFDDINEAIDTFFNLFTRKKKITKFYKGDFSYKHRIELLLDNDEVHNLGTSMTWFFPYWKKTTIKEEVQDEIIAISKIEDDIKEIKNYAQQ